MADQLNVQDILNDLKKNGITTLEQLTERVIAGSNQKQKDSSLQGEAGAASNSAAYSCFVSPSYTFC